jgi:signal transduction histidine kinase
MKLTKKLETEILIVYYAYWDAYLKGDMKTFASFLDDNVTVYGTAAGEVFTNKKEAVKFYTMTADQMTGKADFRKRRIKMKTAGNTIVVNEECDLYVLIDGVWTFYDHARITAIIEQKGNAWKCVHQHGSFPDTRTEEGDQIATEKIKKENRQLKDAVKRRTIELEQKNRELETETALEKVRSVAMGMKERADMLKICKTISQQLAQLGVKEIRNVQTAIFNVPAGTYMNYEYYAKHNKTFITETTYTNHKVARAFAAKMLKGKGQVSITYIKGREKVKEWLNYQKGTNVFIDTYLNTATSLTYYWYSLGPVALGISTYTPLTKDEQLLFSRFLKVFELAYRRYLDIEKAEAQARKAQIEAALERVRVASLSMRDSSALSEIIFKLYGELTKLDAKLDRCFIMIVNPENKGITWWMAGQEGLLAQNGFFVQMNQHVSHLMYLDYCKQRKKKWTYLFEGKEKRDWDRFGFSKTELARLPEPVKAFMSAAKKVFLSGSSDQFGSLVTGSFEPLPEEQQEIISRFTIVFNQAYIRFLDLQKAEAQTREAEIQLALERVRARSLAMHHTSELQEVVNIAAQQLHGIGMDINGGVFIAINTEIDKELSIWASGGMADYIQKVIVPELNKPIFTTLRDAIRNGNSFLIETFSDKEKRELFTHLFKYEPWKSLPKERKEELLSRKGGFARSVVISQYTSISITNHHGKAFNEEENEILKRFGKVFEQSYIRFLDLQKAEAQAREAQIEAALERVRAAAMSMHRSEELLNVCEVLYKEVGALGFNTLRNAMINIHNDEKKSFINYDYSDEIGRSTNHLYYNIHPLVEKQIGTIRSADDAFSETYFTGRDLTTWKNFRKRIGEKNDPRLDKNKGLYYYFYSIGIGSIGISTFGPISEEKKALLKRFRNVFALSYQRYIDIAKAEVQAREAQIELALERVRARTMAMQHSEELSETVTVMFEQFKALGEEPERMAIEIVNEKEQVFDIWATQHGGSQLNLLVQISLDEPHVMQKMYKAWKAKTRSITIDLQGNELEEYFQFLKKAELPVQRKIFGKRRVQNVATFSKGILTIITPEPRPQETIQLLERFAAVFDQTYTRFLDLQKAEAQAREAQIETALEKVRSRTMAMHKSEELRDVIEVVYKQLVDLRLPVEHAGFILDYKKEDDMHIWFASKQVSPTEIKIPYFDSPHWNSFQKAKAHGKSFFANKLNFEEKNKFYKDLFKWIPPLPDEAVQSIFSRPGLIISTVLLENVGLYIENYSQTPFTEEENTLLMRFGKVFQQTYTRFLDLQKAEAQTREAQIETALEKVRSRTMAMQSSNELQETAAVLFQEFKKLGTEEMLQVTIGIYNEEDRVIDFRVTSWSGGGEQENRSFQLDMDEPTLVKHAIAAWKAGKKSAVFDLTGEALQGWLNYRNKISGLNINMNDTGGRRVITAAYFSKGHLTISSLNPLQQETIKTLERFAAVFDGTYTRFLDLERAEAQALRAEQDLIAIKEAKQKAEDALTELQVTQKQLIQSEKMASLGELTAGIAHEIQNPLNFVNNFSEVSKELLDEMREAIEKGDTEEAKEIMNDVIQNLEKINHHGKRADGIVKGMLQHSRSSSNQKEPTDINALADEYLRLAYHGLRAKDKSFNATMKTDYDESIGNINIIPQDIGRVVLNLITNAFYEVDKKKKHASVSQPAGQADSAGKPYEPTVTVSTKRENGNVIIRVKDNANGIPPKVLDKIFQPFFTTKPTGQGTGLGLSLSYDIVKAHGGELTVKTEEGIGSTFIIHLPAKEI